MGDNGRSVELGGRYILVDTIARGGMGVVHEAYDMDLERRVAVKQLRARHSGSVRARARLRHEAAAMARALLGAIERRTSAAPRCARGAPTGRMPRRGAL